MALRIFMVYCSPAGTTRLVGRVLENFLREQGPVGVCELGCNPSAEADFLREIKDAAGRRLLFVGSPVYSSHALPPVMEFIARLPVKPDAWAVPFATWGGATSGLALEEMAEALAARGYKLAGAAKILALHSLMWEAADPVGAGQPDVAAERMMLELVRVVTENLRRDRPPVLSQELLRYQSAAAREDMRKLNLQIARKILPSRVVDEQRCSGCGVCVNSCPVAALSLQPFPVFGENCILCFNCVRLCPEKALVADLRPIHARVRERAERYAETPATQIFIEPFARVEQ
ncbi:MAG TPA: 4Fe-4S dicluster domain-containing protein [Proteobacteria bacterium]|nr:4Fe-4S dicluster domain-containing protein [Pseudomonadota bacterium]